jgi:alanine racemase
MFTRVFSEIDLKAIKFNIEQIKSLMPKNMKLLIPVKADGYGHGSVRVSQFIEKKKLAHMLGVASLEEAVELRNAGVTMKILILGHILPKKEMYQTLIDYNLIQTISDFEIADKMSQFCLKKKKKISLHLKVDTGMGRLGCSSSEAESLAVKINDLKGIDLNGLYTHLPVADEDYDNVTDKQHEIFKALIENLKSRDINPPYTHCSNSAGSVYFDPSSFTMIRPGIMTYGYRPSYDLASPIELKPAMTLKSYIVYTKKVKTDTPISYGHTYKTESNSVIATVAVGYGDGYNRLLSNKGQVLINNKTYPIVGRVCMDLLMVDLNSDWYDPGEEVTLFGQENITVNEVAQWTNTIPYEVTCRIAQRVPRIYHE